MAASKNVTILKTVSLVVLFVVTVVGCHAHFNNIWKELWDIKGAPDVCKAESGCPAGAIPMERTFVALTIICLILSAVSLIASFVMDTSGFKTADGGYHALAGLLIIISGILMIIAAVQIDDYFFKNSGITGMSSQFTKGIAPQAIPITKSDWRKEFKYMNKLAAGALAVINGLLYFGTSAAIFKS